MPLTRRAARSWVTATALWVAAVGSIVFSVFLAGATWVAYERGQEASAALVEGRKMQADLKERIIHITADIERLNDARGLEEEIRTRYPVAREGEELYIIVDAPQAPVDSSEERGESVWARFLRWFGW